MSCNHHFRPLPYSAGGWGKDLELLHLWFHNTYISRMYIMKLNRLILNFNNDISLIQNPAPHYSINKQCVSSDILGLHTVPSRITFIPRDKQTTCCCNLVRTQ